MVLLIMVSLLPDSVLRFAKELEMEGDIFRSITEYKRYIYLVPDADSIRYRIASMYEKNGWYGNAINILRGVKRKNSKYKVSMGKLFYSAGYYDSCDNYWDGRLMGLVYLRKGEINKGMNYLNLRQPPRLKNPALGIALATIVPGLGRVYANRPGDGIFTLFTVLVPTYFSYKYYREDNYLVGGVFGALSLFFYGGNIFGSYISVKIYNTYILDRYISNIEKWLLP